MDPIFDRRGSVVGWLTGDHIVGSTNSYVAYLRGEIVQSMSGRHLGSFSKGFFRDHQGGAVAFVRGATGGPITPIVSSFTPMPPVPPIRPSAPIGIAPVAITPIGSLSWGQEWADFLGGGS
ncbi:MAG: hypothetical protein U0414_42865 [Polyangiaceae bacterium]